MDMLPVDNVSDRNLKEVIKYYKIDCVENNSSERTKSYTLNSKKALEKIVANAKLKDFKSTRTPSCITIQLSSGSYQLAALDFVTNLKESDKVSVDDYTAKW